MIVFDEYLRIKGMSLLKNYSIIAMSLNIWMTCLDGNSIYTGVVNVPNRLSTLYEYKSGTVNGLNNMVMLIHYICKRLAITDY